jgi:GMP synthase-like glutamine amidotransferase
MTAEFNQQQQPQEQSEMPPFPFSNRPFCDLETIEKRIETIRVLVVNDLLRDESDLSDVARAEWGDAVAAKLEQERYISKLAVENIESNITRLVRDPKIREAHISEVTKVAEEFRPQAIVLSGTLSDFDYYSPEMLRRFARFIEQTTIPVLGICGGHQLVGISFGVRCVTLDNLEPAEQREGRPFEYQYHYIRATDEADPIFRGLLNGSRGEQHKRPTSGHDLRVWQNHGLQLERVPEGFKQIATGHRCRNQMMVKRASGQLIYTVQFHLEKSFQDLTRNLRRVDPNLSPEERKRILREEASSRTLWNHRIESRDGRLLFENFLLLALEHTAHEDN